MLRTTFGAFAVPFVARSDLKRSPAHTVLDHGRHRPSDSWISSFCIWGLRKLCPAPLMRFSVTTAICLATVAPSGAAFNFSRFIVRAFSKPHAAIEAEDCEVLFLGEVAEDCWRKRGFPDVEVSTVLRVVLSFLWIAAHPVWVIRFLPPYSSTAPLVRWRPTTSVPTRAGVQLLISHPVTGGRVQQQCYVFLRKFDVFRLKCYV